MKERVYFNKEEVINCGLELIADSDTNDFQFVCTDSRLLKDDESGVFFIPLKGDTFDAHDYLEDLCENKKISGFFTEREILPPSALRNNMIAVKTDGNLSSLGKLAMLHRSRYDIPIVGITGTNGKTTTKELVHTAISSVHKTHKNIKNYNNEIGVPFTLFGLKESHEAAVIEMGMNHSGEIDRLTAMVKPSLAIITNIGEGHLEYLGSLENVAHAKSEIFNGMDSGFALLNADDEFFDFLKLKAQNRGLKVKTFSIENDSDFKPDSYLLKAENIELSFAGQDISVPLYGAHNLYNIMAALAAASILGVPLNLAAASLENFKNADKRSEIHTGKYTVINDTYNSNPLSLKSALKSIRDVYPNRRKVAFLSDMKELGAEEKSLHYKSGAEVFKCDFEVLAVYGGLSEQIAQGAIDAGMDSSNVKYFTTKDDFINSVNEILNEGDVVLVKGSRSMKMEEVADAIVC